MSTLVLALIPAVLLCLTFVAYCLYDLSRSQALLLPRWAWVILILASIPFGGILYLFAGRKQS